jgi:hypothetical protein
MPALLPVNKWLSNYRLRYLPSLNPQEMMVAGDQDEPDDKVVTVEERVELIRAFRQIESAQLRRKIINLVKTLAPKQR